MPRRFHGTVARDPARVGRDASRIADGVIAHLAGIVGADVRVTLEIAAEIPPAAPDHVVRTVTEGARYAFPASLGPEVRGVPTAGSVASLSNDLPEGAGAVWPSSEGRSRGPALTPLYAGAPGAALRDERLHRLLALVDVLRIGQARERKIGETLLHKMLTPS